MSKLKVFTKYWLPVMIWMVLIFSASGDRGSSQRSSRIIAPLVRWLFPGVQDDSVNQVVYYTRKMAHVTEYAILALLLWRALARNLSRPISPWPRRTAGLVLLIAFLYAASDEFHQIFVPNREGRPLDVLIDTSGAAMGLFAIWLLNRWRKPTNLPAPAGLGQDSL